MPAPAASFPPFVVPRLTARVVTHVCGLFFLSRLLVLAVAALSHLVIERGPHGFQAATWVERFCVWDSTWYAGISEAGYFYRPGAESSVAFYPVLPLLMRGAAWLGCDVRLAGYAIAHAALLASGLLLWKLAVRETGLAAVADRAVLFLLFCPGAAWFGMIYTESLFLLTLLGCVLCARQGRWLAAGACGMVSALTRTPGLLLAGFLLLEGAQQWWEHRRTAGEGALPGSGSRWWARVGLAVAGPICGHLAYLGFLQVRFGDWRAQQKTMSAGWQHGGGIRLPWAALADQWQHNDRALMAISTPLLAITLGLALVGLFTLRRVGYTVLIFTLGVLYVSATPGDSVTRYLSTAAPAYIVLAQLCERSRLLETATLVFSVGIMALLTILIVNGYRVV